MRIVLDNHSYHLLEGYQKQDNYRNEFDALAKKTFNLSFEQWYQAGYSNDKYIPYTLFDGGKAVANVSVNVMDFVTLDERQRYIQIGTVMTDKGYRNKGLCCFLMKTVLDNWENKCDFIYLYANESAKALYPKFGFKEKKEYEYFKKIEPCKPKSGAVKLDMSNQKIREKLYHYAKNTLPCGKLSMSENADLVMFYCISLFKDCVYYIRPLNVIVVANQDENKLHLLDIFGRSEVDAEQVMSYLINDKICEVIFGFTPKKTNSYQARVISSDETLFIKDGKSKLFENNRLMFPVLSHA